MMHERTRCPDEAANHQLPIAVAFWIIQTVFVEECSSLTQNMMQSHCSTCSIILNVIATQYTCSFNGIYHPRWLVQWSHHCSHMCIPVNSPWLPGYIDIAQTVLVPLTMTGLFPDRPHIFFGSGNFSCILSIISFTLSLCFVFWNSYFWILDLLNWSSSFLFYCQTVFLFCLFWRERGIFLQF